MSTLRTIIVPLTLAWLTLVKAHSDILTNSIASRMFQFKFQLNKPLIYDYDWKSRQVTDLSAGTHSSLNSKTFEVHYKIRLTAVDTNQDGMTTVLLEPFDFAEDIESVNSSGRLTTSVRGLDIISKQNDMVLVDTKNNIGMGQAQSLKYPVFPYLLSGYLLFDSAGNVKNYSGDLPFVDVWQNKLKSAVGFFGIVFPTNSVSPNDSWTNSILIKDSGGTTYDGDGIVQPNVFIRGADSMTSDVPVASFNLFETDNYQHLVAHIELPGQQTTVDFPERDESMSGTFYFNQKSGVLIGMKTTAKMNDSESFMLQGNPATGHEDNEVETSMQLVLP